jgi:hypothetical protein
MGFLIEVEGVEVTGNLFASNNWRNVVYAGAMPVANNNVYNPGRRPIPRR